jgi:pyridoxal 5'-phosphate synthase pdxT subunit
MKIGVLAVQGAFAEHIDKLREMNIDAMPVRLPGDLLEVDGLIIPGGESTTISRLMNAYSLTSEIVSLAGKGFPVFGTCAGMIMMAKRIIGDNTPILGLMDIVVRRNAFGRQVDSFETEIAVPAVGEPSFPAVFIRAPVIESYDKKVEVLARLADDTVIAARQGNLLVTAFHPELTDDQRLHKLFIDMIMKTR